tara:strand:- start:828 stop:1004 length:177 start_codon:yes stop_codon:yes gene_type:complete
MKNFNIPDVKLEDLSYCVCIDCGNGFYVIELPMAINDPKFCPYCGVDFYYCLGEEDDS